MTSHTGWTAPSGRTTDGGPAEPTPLRRLDARTAVLAAVLGGASPAPVVIRDSWNEKWAPARVFAGPWRVNGKPAPECWPGFRCGPAGLGLDKPPVWCTFDNTSFCKLRVCMGRLRRLALWGCAGLMAVTAVAVGEPDPA